MVIRAVGSDLVGISSLASGADQLFASEVLKTRGRLHVVVPCREYEKSFTTRRDAKTFVALLKQANSVETLDYSKPSQEAFLQAGRRVVDLSDLLVAIWDGNPAQGRGGTGDIVRYATELGKPLRTIWPSGQKR